MAKYEKNEEKKAEKAEDEEEEGVGEETLLPSSL